MYGEELLPWQKQLLYCRGHEDMSDCTIQEYHTLLCPPWVHVLTVCPVPLCVLRPRVFPGSFSLSLSLPLPYLVPAEGEEGALEALDERPDVLQREGLPLLVKLGVIEDHEKVAEQAAHHGNGRV